MEDKFKLFSGRSTVPLSTEVAEYLGVDLSTLLVKSFADGELYTQIQESVRNCDVYYIHSTGYPANENYMELFIAVDAFKRASARTISVVMPYYGYARADRKTAGREAVTAKLVANLLTTAGADRVFSIDLHSGQIQAFFEIPMDHLTALRILISYVEKKQLSALTIVSPDAGGAARASRLASQMGPDITFALIDKRRTGHNEAHAMSVVGDVAGRHCVLVDDMIDTAGTICEAARALKEAGALSVYACATHGVFSGEAISRLMESCITEVIVTNTLPLTSFPKLKVQSVGALIGEAIQRTYRGDSLSAMFK